MPPSHARSQDVDSLPTKPLSTLRSPSLQLSKPVDAVFKFMVKKWSAVAYGDLTSIRIVFEEEAPAPTPTPTPTVGPNGPVEVEAGVPRPAVSEAFVWGASRGGEKLADLAESLPEAARGRLCREQVLDLTYTFVSGPLGPRQPLLPNRLMGNIAPSSSTSRGAGGSSPRKEASPARRSGDGFPRGSGVGSGGVPEGAAGAAVAGGASSARVATGGGSARATTSKKKKRARSMMEADADDEQGSSWIDVGCEASSQGGAGGATVGSGESPLGFLAKMHTAAVASGIAERQDAASSSNVPAAAGVPASSGVASADVPVPSVPPFPSSLSSSSVVAAVSVATAGQAGAGTRSTATDPMVGLEDMLDRGDEEEGSARSGGDVGAVAGGVLIGEETCMALFGGNDTRVDLLLDSPSQLSVDARPGNGKQARRSVGAANADIPAVTGSPAPPSVSSAALSGAAGVGGGGSVGAESAMPPPGQKEAVSPVAGGGRSRIADRSDARAADPVRSARSDHAPASAGAASQSKTTSGCTVAARSLSGHSPDTARANHAKSLPTVPGTRFTARHANHRESGVAAAAARSAEAEAAGVSPSGRDERQSKTGRNGGGEPAAGVANTGGAQSQRLSKAVHRSPSGRNGACDEGDATDAASTDAAPADVASAAGEARPMVVSSSKRPRSEKDEAGGPNKKGRGSSISKGIDGQAGEESAAAVPSTPVISTLSSRPFAFAAAKSSGRACGSDPAKSKNRGARDPQAGRAAAVPEGSKSPAPPPKTMTTSVPNRTPPRRSPRTLSRQAIQPSPSNSFSPLWANGTGTPGAAVDISELSSFLTPLQDFHTSDAIALASFPSFWDASNSGSGLEVDPAHAPLPERNFTRWSSPPASKDRSEGGGGRGSLDGQAALMTAVAAAAMAAPQPSAPEAGSADVGPAPASGSCSVDDGPGGRPLPTLIRLGRSMTKGVPLLPGVAAAPPAQDASSSVAVQEARGGKSRREGTAGASPGTTAARQRGGTNKQSAKGDERVGDGSTGGRDESVTAPASGLAPGDSAVASSAGGSDGTSAAPRPRRRAKKSRIAPTLVTTALPASSSGTGAATASSASASSSSRPDRLASRKGARTRGGARASKK